ncbi:glutathione S-transferase [Dinoroseobacter sp. S124A]|uniref:glutathione S-transferase n=1 Tax=Dinoroseobacter sp. S124A TaxID=3415128 RepID=UPI003C7C619F
MTYDLLIADRSYSSWSLRGWLCLAAFDLPHTLTETRMYTAGFRDDLAAFAPGLTGAAAPRTVPMLRLPEGGVLSDSLAIAETLAERHPEAGLWPADPVARALARSLVSEMHSGFTALREACPMNLRVAYRSVPVSEAVRADLDRLEALWAACPAEGPWLFGDYTLADAFFAPVAMRIAGYGLSVGAQAQAYVTAHLAHGPLRDWRAKGLAQAEQSTYLREFETVDWPG